MSDTTHTPTLPDEAHIGRVALTVSNLSAVTEFYRDVVGLAVIHRSEDHAGLGVDDNTETPLLVLNKDSGAPSRQRAEAGLFHTAFRVPSRAALGDALQRIQTQWPLDGASDHLVSEALYLTDPEGNGVEIYRDFPRDEWPVTNEGDIQMATDPLDMSPIEAAATGKTGVPSDTSIGHVHLEVSDLYAFEDFYVDTVGFGMQTSMTRARFVAAGGYHHHIGANTWNGRSSKAQGRGLTWFEVVVPEDTQLASLRDRLQAHEVSIQDTAEGFAVTDTDNIDVRFCSES